MNAQDQTEYLDRHSIDDLHVMSSVEVEHDRDAWQLLQDVYQSLRREYFEAVRLVRERAR